MDSIDQVYILEAYELYLPDETLSQLQQVAWSLISDQPFNKQYYDEVAWNLVFCATPEHQETLLNYAVYGQHSFALCVQLTAFLAIECAVPVVQILPSIRFPSGWTYATIRANHLIARCAHYLYKTRVDIVLPPVRQEYYAA